MKANIERRRQGPQNTCWISSNGNFLFSVRDFRARRAWNGVLSLKWWSFLFTGRMCQNFISKTLHISMKSGSLVWNVYGTHSRRLNERPLCEIKDFNEAFRWDVLIKELKDVGIIRWIVRTSTWLFTRPWNTSCRFSPWLDSERDEWRISASRED